MEKQSPTDFLVGALEDIEGAEDCILVYRKVEDGKDVIDWKANDVTAWKAVGMLMWVANDMQANSVVDEGEEK